MFCVDGLSPWAVVPYAGAGTAFTCTQGTGLDRRTRPPMVCGSTAAVVLTSGAHWARVQLPGPSHAGRV
eukprot:3120869-Pyramimonas_sp.AAC.1